MPTSGIPGTFAKRASGGAGIGLALLLACGSARADDPSGVYVSPAGGPAQTLHLRAVDNEIAGRLITPGRTFGFTGWLDEPGYMGTMFDMKAPDQGVFFFVAVPGGNGIQFSLYAIDANGDMDLEKPQHVVRLNRAPGRSPEIPDDLLAGLTGGSAPDGASSGTGGAPTPAPAALSRSTGTVAPAGGGGPFHGSFFGEDARGGETLIQFAQSGGRVQGQWHAFGDVAALTGTATGRSVEGTLTADGATGTFKGTLENDRLAITFVIRTENGETSVPFQMKRGVPDHSGDLDPRLFGTWVKSSSYTSGDFSVAQSQTAVIRPDGTVTLGGSRMAGGGDAGSFDSGPAGEGQTMRWYTKGNLLYVDGQLYARYGFSGNTLGLWFSEGGKPQIWSRQ
jgi:hypothetical protein